jgi:hypothetical protein
VVASGAFFPVVVGVGGPAAWRRWRASWAAWGPPGWRFVIVPARAHRSDGRRPGAAHVRHPRAAARPSRPAPSTSRDTPNVLPHAPPVIPWKTRRPGLLLLAGWSLPALAANLGIVQPAADFLNFAPRPTLAIDVVNLFDAQYAYRIANGFNGSHWAPGRSVYVRGSVNF